MPLHRDQERFFAERYSLFHILIRIAKGDAGLFITKTQNGYLRMDFLTVGRACEGGEKTVVRSENKNENLCTQ